LPAQIPRNVPLRKYRSYQAAQGEAMILYKIIRHFIDKKTGLPDSGQYGRTVFTEKEAADLLRKMERSHPGHRFEIQEKT
jgi:hypothetical protein